MRTNPLMRSTNIFLLDGFVCGRRWGGSSGLWFVQAAGEPRSCWLLQPLTRPPFSLWSMCFILLNYMNYFNKSEKWAAVLLTGRIWKWWTARYPSSFDIKISVSVFSRNRLLQETHPCRKYRMEHGKLLSYYHIASTHSWRDGGLRHDWARFYQKQPPGDKTVDSPPQPSVAWEVS